MIAKSFSPDRTLCHVTFVFHPPAGVTAASVCADFNGWTPSVHPLAPTKDGGFVTTVALPVGRQFEFKYLCSRGGWHNDPLADGHVANTWGQVNSLVRTTGPWEANTPRTRAPVPADVAAPSVPVVSVAAKKQRAKRKATAADRPPESEKLPGPAGKKSGVPRLSQKAAKKKAAPAKKAPAAKKKRGRDTRETE